MGDDWASRFVAKVVKKQNDAKEQGRLSMHKRGMISSQAPLLWDDLCHAIKEKADKVNESRNYFTCSPLAQGRTQYEIESPAGHLLLVYQDEVPIVKFTLTKTIDDARPKPEQVNGDLTFQLFDESVWFTDKNGNRMGSSKAAEFFLDMHS